MILGWRTFYIDEYGLPSKEKTKYFASCFMVLKYIIYVGEVKFVSDYE